MLEDLKTYTVYTTSPGEVPSEISEKGKTVVNAWKLVQQETIASDTAKKILELVGQDDKIQITLIGSCFILLDTTDTAIEKIRKLPDIDVLENTLSGSAISAPAP